MDNKKQANYVIIGTIAILVAIGIAMYFLTGNSNTYSYSNGNSVFEVTILSDSETKIPIYFEGDDQPYAITVRNDPKSLEDIPLYGNPVQRIVNDEVVFITIDPDQELRGKTVVAVYEIQGFIDNTFFYNTPVYTTLTKEYGEEEKLIRTCDDASDSQTVIYVTLGEETGVSVDGYCIIVMGTDEDEIIRAADRLALHLVGIMP